MTPAAVLWCSHVRHLQRRRHLLRLTLRRSVDGLDLPRLRHHERGEPGRLRARQHRRERNLRRRRRHVRHRQPDHDEPDGHAPRRRHRLRPRRHPLRGGLHAHRQHLLRPRRLLRDGGAGRPLALLRAELQPGPARLWRHRQPGRRRAGPGAGVRLQQAAVARLRQDGVRGDGRRRGGGPFAQPPHHRRLGRLLRLRRPRAPLPRRAVQPRGGRGAGVPLDRAHCQPRPGPRRRRLRPLPRLLLALRRRLGDEHLAGQHDP